MTKAASKTIIVLTDMLKGVLCKPDGKPPFGRNLRCPMCGKHAVTIKLGYKAPVAFCGSRTGTIRTGCKAKGAPLIKAIRKEKGIWLAPPPRREMPRKVVERMRRSPAYEGLPPRSKALVEHLIEAVFVHGEPNREISLTGTELMGIIGLRSWKQLYRAVSAAVDAEIVTKGSRALSHGYGRGPVNLWGLACLPKGWFERPTKAVHNPNSVATGGGRTWGENVGRGGERGPQPIDLAGGGCGIVYEPSAQSASEPPRHDGEAGARGTSGPIRKGTSLGGASGRVVGRSPPPSSAPCGSYECRKGCRNPGTCPAFWRVAL